MKNLIPALLLLIACEPQTPHSMQHMLADDMAETSVSPDLSAPAVDMAAPDMALNTRIVLKKDTSDGIVKPYDMLYGVPVHKQPLCAGCDFSNFKPGEWFALPWNTWEGQIVVLTPYSTDGWWVDPFCTQKVFGLHVSFVGKSHPTFAYDFDEKRKTARMFTAEPLDKNLMYRTSFTFDCVRATAIEDANERAIFVPYRQVEQIASDKWVPWSEAQRVIDAGMKP